MRLDPARHAWMRDERTQRIMAVLPEARFVGGAVRNALLNQDVSDIDLAIPLPPEPVMDRLKAAGLNVVPTGIEHGTVTAVVGGKPFEVTSLRCDVQTDGRRAVVSYTSDWKTDSERRDFTINALYAAADGEVFDYHGGIADLENGRVRFVGEASVRIREDYLRILRLFRFHAWYGRGPVDAEALRAAIDLKSGIASLSGERLQKEMLRLLAAADPVPVLTVMQQTGILDEILPGAGHFDVLKGLISARIADPVVRLAALLPRGSGAGIAARLRLSNVQTARLVILVDSEPVPVDSRAARRVLYRFGPADFADLVQLSQARDGSDRAALLNLTVPPKFPLTGHDAIKAGFSEGPRLGRILADIETAWIENDFAETRDQLLARLSQAAATPTT